MGPPHILLIIFVKLPQSYSDCNPTLLCYHFTKIYCTLHYFTEIIQKLE
jgi:hypothetical protein